MDTAKTAITPRRHPVYGLCSSLLKHDSELTLEFSRYVHLGLGRTLSREIFHVQARYVDDAWLADKMCRLTGAQELALHSRVTHKNRIYHIPMVDFAEVDSIELLLSKMHAVRQSLPVDITLYNSGRSVHGYYFCLIDEKDWYRYVGRLLLCNPPSDSKREFIDSRWIGHSLEHGFSALRWSCKSGIYKSLPELVDIDSFSPQGRDIALDLS
jgi:hypothetical protein